MSASMRSAACCTAWTRQRPNCTMPASGTRCCTARKPRSGPSCHCRAVAIVSRTIGATMATSSDNGDGHVSAEREAAFKGPGKAWGVMRKAPKGSPLHPLDVQINHIIASPLSLGPMARQWQLRARVEHPFRVIKRQFGHVKTRSRGPRQEPRPDIHPVRARQPVPRAKKLDGMRTVLPENGRATAKAAPKPRNQRIFPERGVPATFRRPSRRSRRR